MMSFFKSLFGLGNKGSAVRKLSHPRDLRAGDIIKFHFIDQPDVSGQQFEVALINTYLYGDLCYPELVLKDRSGHIIYMMVEEEDGEEYLALSKKVKKAEISHFIPDLDSIITPGTGAKITIPAKPEGFTEWLSNSYQKVDDSVKGSFVKGDARYLSNEAMSRREHFTAYVLEDDESEYALEVEKYQTGEVELSVTVYQDINAIEELWPGQSDAENP